MIIFRFATYFFITFLSYVEHFDVWHFATHFFITLSYIKDFFNVYFLAQGWIGVYN